MGWAFLLRDGLAGLLLIGSVLGLIRMIRIRETPVLRRARLFACLCSALLGLALLTAGTRSMVPAVFLALAGVGCGLAWLAILYANSLHNTTM